MPPPSNVTVLPLIVLLLIVSTTPTELRVLSMPPPLQSAALSLMVRSVPSLATRWWVKLTARPLSSTSSTGL